MTQKPPPLRVTMANAVVGKVGNNGAGTNGAIFGQAPKKKIKFANSGIPGCRSLDGKPICTKKNFISADECERLMAHAMSPAAVWATDMPKDHQWYNRIIHLQKMPPDIRALMIQIRKRAAAAIKAEYGITEMSMPIICSSCAGQWAANKPRTPMPRSLMAHPIYSPGAPLPRSYI